ncbi:4-hydroxybenzoate octaprenyltransferase [Candidatus Pelagibacter communis]|uniref:4-hydroxybenzoate octaprenyltransferase n=1 Tax=Candidatus Pelagibacter TaxID=198251 RepID=UPI003EDE8F87
MNQLKLFIELARLKKPIGYMLLFWPCAWGLTAAYDFSGEKVTFIKYLFFFLAGAILMRSAGCIVNDIIDQKFDKKVERTKNRPIASGKISKFQGLLYTIILCFIALLVLLQFNNLTIWLAMLSMPFAFTYPLLKRFTYWPQLFLGFTFNYGLVLGWTSISNNLSFYPLIFYLGTIFWTLAYDTIYGFQDIKDDEIIGLKSTSIKFKKNPIIFLGLSYGIFLMNLIGIGYLIQLNIIYYLVIIIVASQMFYFQIYKLNYKEPLNCLKKFQSNNFVGFLIFIALILGKIA